MKLMRSAAVLCVLAQALVAAQPQSPRKLRFVLDVRAESEASRAAFTDGMRRELRSLADVEIVPPGESARTIRVIVSSAPGFYAASALVTERYDRETLMVLGIEDDDTANRMMALQIVNEHLIVAGADTADVARRIVAALETGLFVRLRR